MEKTKRRWGDRKDGVWLKDLDSMHLIGSYLLRNRADREAFIEETVDLTRVKEYLSKKNAENPGSTYTIFQVVCAAIVKTLVQRPKLNRFISGRRVYQRNYISLAFVSKNSFHDDGAESLLVLYVNEDNTIDDLHQLMNEKLKEVREQGQLDHSTDLMNKLGRLPRCILAIIFWVIRSLDYFGRVPWWLIKEDPDFASIYLTNLGSINLNAGYHHLNNWGTNSLFVVIGKKGPRPFYNKNGEMEMKDTIKIGITLDELIVDGYYYAKSIKLFRYIIEHPELLDSPANEEIIYD